MQRLSFEMGAWEMRSAAKQQLFFSVQDLGRRWGISPFTIRRLIDAAQLKSVRFGARWFVPLDEVTRAEREGAGAPPRRKRSG